MTSISENLHRLQKMRFPAASLPQSRRGDRLTELADFGPNLGALRARLHVPPTLAPNAPLVVVLHGCTQTAAGYDFGSGWSVLADRHGFAVLYPEQQRANNPNLCFNWFVADDIGRGDGEAASIAQMVERVAADHAIDRDRVFVTGLSAGGAMTSVMLAAYPEMFAGGAIIAGLPYGVARSVPEAFARMQGKGDDVEGALPALVRAASPHQGSWPTISIWHGTADATVGAHNAEAILDQWRALHGVPQEPAAIEFVGRYPRRTWRDATGRAVIEHYTMTGMGHGTPVAAREGVGSPCAYFLETDLSSTLRIAEFWGIAQIQAGHETLESLPEAARGQIPTGLHRAASAEMPFGLSEATSPLDAKVQQVIESALRSAGLMP